MGLGEPADLVVGGRGARAQRVDLAVQPGQPLAAVGGGAVQAGDPALLLGDGVLGGTARGDRLLEGAAVLLDLGLDRALLLAHLGGLGLERLGVAAGGDLAGAEPLGVADPLGGQRLGAAQPLAQPGQREPGLLGLGQRGQVLAERRLELALAAGRPSARWPSTSSRRATSTDSSASSCSSAARAVTRSSAISRALASRTADWTPAARRATSAWRPSGLSWRRISPSRSVSRVRLPSQASSLRSAFSLRLRCLRTPAASSMKPRRSSGVACRIESSWPWPTMTCISRPMPESESSSWTSSRRHGVPLMAYSEPPLRNMVRLIVTSEYSIGSAPSELSMVSSTSARPSGGRPDVPAKMTSSILPPRSDLAPCSPITQASASTTLDLPEPLGPTTQVIPGSSWSVVEEAKDLNPLRVRLFRYTRCSLANGERSADGRAADAGEAQRSPTLPAGHPRTVNPGRPARRACPDGLRRVASRHRRQPVDQHVEAELEPRLAVAGGHLGGVLAQHRELVGRQRVQNSLQLGVDGRVVGLLAGRAWSSRARPRWTSS